MKCCTQQQILNWMNVTLRLFVQHSSVEKRFQTGTEY